MVRARPREAPFTSCTLNDRRLESLRAGVAPLEGLEWPAVSPMVTVTLFLGSFEAEASADTGVAAGSLRRLGAGAPSVAGLYDGERLMLLVDEVAPLDLGGVIDVDGIILNTGRGIRFSALQKHSSLYAFDRCRQSVIP